MSGVLNPFLLNMQNGTYDLTTQQVLPHNPDDLITKITTSGLGEPGDGPFHEFMRQILPDAELHDYVQRLMGYSLLGVVREHVLPILYGRQGRNGKSVFLNTVMSTLGDFADTVDNSLIIQQRFQQHRTFKAKLAGLRLAVTKESDGGARLNAADVKELTGGDRLQANLMRQNEFSWEPSHTLLLYTNFKPLARGDDDALWERIRIVTFEQQFTDGDKNTNKQLEERLKLHFPEVLRWLVDGYAAYVNDGELVTPDRVRRDTEELRDECDDLGGFLEDCTHTIDGALAPGRTTFEAWTNWCRGQNLPHGSEKSFKRRMTDRGFKHTSKRVHGIVTRGYENIELHIGGLSEAGGGNGL
jgi:putative DNA primase/helicase